MKKTLCSLCLILSSFSYGLTQDNSQDSKPRVTPDMIRRDKETKSPSSNFDGKLEGRSLNTSPSIDLKSSGIKKSGIVSLSIEVNRTGTVVSANVNFKKGTRTNTSDRELCEKASELAFELKFNADPSAPITQNGEVTFTFAPH